MQNKSTNKKPKPNNLEREKRVWLTDKVQVMQLTQIVGLLKVMHIIEKTQ